jgi:hypothetical protein
MDERIDDFLKDVLTALAGPHYRAKMSRARQAICQQQKNKININAANAENHV